MYCWARKTKWAIRLSTRLSPSTRPSSPTATKHRHACVMRSQHALNLNTIQKDSPNSKPALPCCNWKKKQVQFEDNREGLGNRCFQRKRGGVGTIRPLPEILEHLFPPPLPCKFRLKPPLGVPHIPDKFLQNIKVCPLVFLVLKLRKMSENKSWSVGCFCETFALWPHRVQDEITVGDRLSSRTGKNIC